MTELPGVLGILVAALGGVAVGIERQRSGHASGPGARLGGVRTFTLLGGTAGLAGWLTTQHLPGLAIVLAAGAVGVVIAGYIAASRTDVDATTEVAALVVIGAGLSAGVGWLTVASAVIAVSVLLLVEKSQLHALVGRIDDEELRAAARFGVMAVVILPLLPEGPFGPWGGIRPRTLWLLVLFFTGLSFSGYLARRIFGATQGYPLAGLLAGLISSTNATFTFARLSRREQWLSRPLAIGTVAACTSIVSTGPRRDVRPRPRRRRRAAALPRGPLRRRRHDAHPRLADRGGGGRIAATAVEPAADQARSRDGGPVPGRAVRGRGRAPGLWRERTADLRRRPGSHRRRRADHLDGEGRRGRHLAHRCCEGDRDRHPRQLSR